MCTCGTRCLLSVALTLGSQEDELEPELEEEEDDDGDAVTACFQLCKREPASACTEAAELAVLGAAAVALAALRRLLTAFPMPDRRSSRRVILGCCAGC